MSKRATDASVAAALVAKDREIEELRGELADMLRTAFYFAQSMPLVTARYAAHRAERADQKDAGRAMSALVDYIKNGGVTLEDLRKELGL